MPERREERRRAADITIRAFVGMDRDRDPDKLMPGPEGIGVPVENLNTDPSQIAVGATPRLSSRFVYEDTLAATLPYAAPYLKIV